MQYSHRATMQPFIHRAEKEVLTVPTSSCSIIDQLTAVDTGGDKGPKRGSPRTQISGPFQVWTLSLILIGLAAVGNGQTVAPI